MAQSRMDHIQLTQPLDKQIPQSERNRPSRWVVLIASSVATVLLPFMVTSYVGGALGHQTIGGFVGFGIGVWLLGYFMPRMLVYNPEWTAYVTQDAVFGNNVPYGPGLHPAHWWEQRNASGNYSLRVITRPFDATIATNTAAVTIKGQFGYAISLPYVSRAIGVDKTFVEDGFIAFIESFLTEKCAQYPDGAEGVRKDIRALNDQLASQFMDQAAPVGSGAPITVEEFERTVGFTTAIVVIDTIGLPAAVQRTRDAVDEAAQLYEVMAQLRGTDAAGLKQLVADGAVLQKERADLRNRAMAVSENANMAIPVIEGDISAAVAQALAGQAGQGGRGGRP